MTQHPLPQGRLNERRDRTVTALCEHFAQDRLELAEFEQRLDAAHRASTLAELDALVADLPAAPAPAPPPATRSDTAARALDAVRDTVRDTRTYVALMGGVERRGAWSPARRNLVIAVMGGVELDFRDVDLPPGETEVFIFCTMGGAEIIVPPDLPVDASGIAIMGGFAHSSAGRRSDPDSPVLRISGFCLMGGAEISVRLPGESGRDASRRRREEKRLERDERRRIHEERRRGDDRQLPGGRE